MQYAKRIAFLAVCPGGIINEIFHPFNFIEEQPKNLPDKANL